MRTHIARLGKFLLLMATALVGCNIDRTLEGVDSMLGYLVVTLSEGDLEVPQGTEKTFTASVERRTGGYDVPVTLTVENLPAGITSVVAPNPTIDAEHKSTVSVTLRAAADAPKVSARINLYVRANRMTEAKAARDLTILDAPRFTLTPASSSVSMIAGGKAPVPVTITRVSSTAAVQLSLTAPPGISADFSPNPATGANAMATIAVTTSVSPGTYTATVTGRAAGLQDQSIPLSVVVTQDRIQLLADSALSVPQGDSAAVPLTINRNNFGGPVTLSAEGLPTGVSASFQPGATTTNQSTLKLTIAPTTAPGSYPIVVRGQGADIPDGTKALTLIIVRASIAIGTSPSSVSVLQAGASAAAAITITRTSFGGGVSLSIEGAPAGLSAAVTPPVAGANDAKITILAPGGFAPGNYNLLIRATPNGFPASASATATLRVTVSAPSTTGNVTLDWSACPAPNWVAWQNGTGPWVQAPVVNGIVRFTIDSANGGYAFVQGGEALAVRYRTRAELTGGPIVMCHGPGKSISGVAVVRSTQEAPFTYNLGGASTTSTPSTSSFTLGGVRDGVHDLVAFGAPFTSLPSPARILIRRDVNLPDGGSLGAVDMAGSESVLADRAAFTGQGLGTGEQASQAMDILTTAACTANRIYDSSPGLNNFVLGMPATELRPTDFHRLTASVSSNGITRSRILVFHELVAQAPVIPVPLAAPSISSIAGSYKRIQAGFGTLPGTYNDSVSVRYTDGSKSMSISQSVAYTGAAQVLVAMPDLSGVSAWSSAYAIAASAPATWTLTVEGNSGGSECTANRQGVRETRAGAF